jgi:DNA-binding transcriptional LysR family regulator
MHVKSLKVFCDVVGRRSFSRAADENGISQSGASQMVHQLEERLGVKLIDRSKRPFVLTAEGQVYYDGCRKLVQRMAALEEEVRTLHQDVAGKVSVAAIYSVGLSHLNQYVREFLSQHPKANVRLEYQHPDRVYELVKQDRVDIGLVSYPKSSRSVKAIPWREEPMVMVCAPAHPLAERGSVRLAELHGLDLVSFDQNLQIRREVDRTLAAREVECNVVMEFDNIETIKRAIEINAGFGLLPAPTVEREVAFGTLVTVGLSDVQMVRPLGIIHRRGKEVGKSARRFMNLLRERAADPLSPPVAELASGVNGHPARLAGDSALAEANGHRRDAKPNARAHASA